MKFERNIIESILPRENKRLSIISTTGYICNGNVRPTPMITQTFIDEASQLLAVMFKFNICWTSLPNRKYPRIPKLPRITERTKMAPCKNLGKLCLLPSILDSTGITWNRDNPATLEY